jgi:hypothetical protein
MKDRSAPAGQACGRGRQRRLRWPVTLAAATLGLALVGIVFTSPANAIPTDPGGGGGTSVPFSFVNAESNQCLDVPGNSSSQGITLHLYTCNSTGAQVFHWVDTNAGRHLVNVHTGLCVVPDINDPTFLTITQRGCSSGADFNWVLRASVNGSVELSNPFHNGFCLMDHAPGPAQLYTCDFFTASNWYVRLT